MEKVIWTDKFSVDNKIIDGEHRRLLSIFSRMVDHVQKNDDNKKMVTLLSEMADYAIQHFKSEENYMRSISYPKLDEHMELHSKYSADVLKFTINYLGQNQNKPIEVLTFLKDWWTGHILEEDSRYVLRMLEK